MLLLPDFPGWHVLDRLFMTWFCVRIAVGLVRFAVIMISQLQNVLEPDISGFPIYGLMRDI